MNVAFCLSGFHSVIFLNNIFKCNFVSVFQCYNKSKPQMWSVHQNWEAKDEITVSNTGVKMLWNTFICYYIFIILYLCEMNFSLFVVSVFLTFALFVTLLYLVSFICWYIFLGFWESLNLLESVFLCRSVFCLLLVLVLLWCNVYFYLLIIRSIPQLYPLPLHPHPVCFQQKGWVHAVDKSSRKQTDDGDWRGRW